MIETHLAPGLLLAMPRLVDPSFHRSVVLMIEHNDEGSFGLVVNRPIEVATFELLATMDIPWRGDQQALVWSGGPVMPSSGWILHTPVASLSSSGTSLRSGTTIDVCPGLAMSCSPEALATLAEEPPERIRLLLGYSGWGAGQLASEMARSAWLHADVDLELLFDTPAEEMWERALRSLGIDPQTIAHGGGVN